MNDLEERLAVELDAVATRFDAPYVDIRGLVSAGRRERLRPRVLTGVLTVAAAVALAAGIMAVLPGDEARDPARTPDVATDPVGLGRPLELPWWGWDGHSTDPTRGTLRIGGAEVPADGVTALVHGGGTTMVEQRAGTWSVLEGDMFQTLGFETLAPPVVGAEGSIAFVGLGATDVYSVFRDDHGEVSSRSVVGSEPPVVVGMVDNSVLMTITDRLYVWARGATSLSPVTGLPREVDVDEIRPWPGGVAIFGDDDTVVTGTVDGTRFRTGWSAPVENAEGVWSDNGKRYAEASGGEVRFAAETGTVAATLDQDHLRVVGWESATEVVVAQWIEVDGAVTGLWRCSAVELRCAAIDGAPTGRLVLPGLTD
jgi:hypothetical protein